MFRRQENFQTILHHAHIFYLKSIENQMEMHIILSIFGPLLVLLSYDIILLPNCFLIPMYHLFTVHVVVKVHLQLYMCLLGVIGEPVSWSHQDAGRWGGVDLLYLGVLWVWNSVHARTERSPPRVRLHLSVCRQGGRFLPPLSSEGEFSFYIIFSRPSLIICIVFSFKQKKTTHTWYKTEILV